MSHSIEEIPVLSVSPAKAAEQHEWSSLSQTRTALYTDRTGEKFCYCDRFV